MGAPFPRLPHWRRWRLQRRVCKQGRHLNQVHPRPLHLHDQINSSTMGERAVITSNWIDAHSPIANEHMSVTTVSRNTLFPNVVLVVQSPLHLSNFHKYTTSHPDQAWCTKLLQGIECGVNIGFQGERMSMVSDNWKSALDHLEVNMSILPMRVAAGCKAGPFTQPPFPDFVRSLMGKVTKKGSFPVKYRIIHNLSWPPEDSINDHIDLDSFRCFYWSFDDAVAIIVKHEVGALSTKMDLDDAFKHIPIRIQDWPLLGSSWDLQCPDSSTCCLYYMDLFLPFGLHSSLALFNKYIDALRYAMKTKYRACYIYLDDYFTFGPPHSPVCANNITTMIATCKELGFAINSDKVMKPATTTNFLGVDIDSVGVEAWIDPTCLSETIALLEDIAGH